MNYPNHEIDVGLCLPHCGDFIPLRIKPRGLSRTTYHLTPNEARELARGLQLMADLHEKLKMEPA